MADAPARDDLRFGAAAEAETPDNLLLDHFAAFYEEVADIRLAIRAGELSAHLTRKGHPPPTDAMELAAMVSSRLKNRLQAQAREVRDNCTETEQRAHRIAVYVMAALADEVFLLDEQTRWEGREAWLHYLIERALFRTGSSGRDFFKHLDRLLQSRVNDDLHADLASVFLIALQLGFQGQHRGAHGAAALKSYRDRLLRYIHAWRQPAPGEPAFRQAYEHQLAETEEKRLAPLARWYRGGAIALGVYAAISSFVWIAIVLPFTNHFRPG